MTLPASSHPQELSVLGKKWIFPDIHDRDVMTLIQTYDLSEMAARILVNRGYNKTSAGEMLSPSLKQMLPNPSLLKDMDKGAARVKKAITDKEKIAIFADYDVDGATSSAILRRYFDHLGIETRLYIPDRIEEGYGPSVEAMEILHREGIQVIIMVDCGTLAYDPLQKAKDLGIDVIVLDHHMSEVKLPEAFALINPNRIDESHQIPYLGELCAAGVTFLFLVALQRALRDCAFFDTDTVKEMDLRLLLDLVALGTVCDVMPLTHLNRVFVSHGLTLIQKRYNPGLSALMNVGGVKEEVSSYHLGFVLGPRVNAGGRVGESWLGSELLTTHDRIKAKNIAEKLDHLNQERQSLEKLVLEEATHMVESQKLDERPIILVGSENWHPGVIGIAASRLTEKFQRPSLVVSYMFGDEGKGSGRSIPTVNLGSLMHKTVERGLLIKGGGHPMAAGFTVAKHQFDGFYQALCDLSQGDVAAHEPELTLEGWLSIPGITGKFIKDIERLEPFGQGNTTPKFALHNLDTVYVEEFSQSHLRISFRDEGGHILKAVAFRVLNSPLGEFLLNKPKGISVVGTLREETWNGKSTISMNLIDAR